MDPSGLNTALMRLSSWIAGPLLAVAATIVVGPEGPLGMPHLVLYTLFACGLAPLSSSRDQPLPGVLVTTAATCAVFAAVCGANAALVLRTAIAGVTLALFTMAAHAWLVGRAGQPRAANTIFLLAFVALCFAPLVLGPLAELWPTSIAFANSIVAASPVSYVASLAGFDYLREQWFYQNVSLGALRFEYPPPAMTTLVYLLIAAALSFGQLRARGRLHRFSLTNKGT